MGGGLAAIILAAGYSSRMGAFKPLLPLGEVTVVERAVQLFRAAGVEDVRVVIGHRAAELAPLLERLAVRVVVNEHYGEGMYSSVVAGVASLGVAAPGAAAPGATPCARDCDAFFLLPVDIPLVRPETVELLARARRDTRKGIVYPAFRGTQGHPPLIAGEYRERILAWDGAGGLTGLLRQYEADSATVAADDVGVVLDMDTLEEYGRLRDLVGDPAVPSRRTCRLLLDERFGAGGRAVITHSEAVARFALAIAARLNVDGAPGAPGLVRAPRVALDLALLEAAALLHDIGKGERDHAAVGAIMLRAIGCPRVAELVAVHIDPPIHAGGALAEADLLSLADRLLDGDRLVSLEARFRPSLERCAGDPEVLPLVELRLERARALKRRVELQLGVPVEALWEAGSA